MASPAGEGGGGGVSSSAWRGAGWVGGRALPEILKLGEGICLYFFSERPASLKPNKMTSVQGAGSASYDYRQHYEFPERRRPAGRVALDSVLGVLVADARVAGSPLARAVLADCSLAGRLNDPQAAVTLFVDPWEPAPRSAAERFAWVRRHLVDAPLFPSFLASQGCATLVTRDAPWSVVTTYDPQSRALAFRVEGASEPSAVTEPSAAGCSGSAGSAGGVAGVVATEAVRAGKSLVYMKIKRKGEHKNGVS